MNLAQLVTDACYLAAPDNCFDTFDAELKLQTAGFAEAAATFRGNMEAAVTVASVPFLMAQQAAQRQRFVSIHTAERIRARSKMPYDKKDEATSQELEDEARQIANTRFETEMNSPEVVYNLSIDTARRLDEALSNDRFRSAASLLLAETLVMAWGAFETFAGDVIRRLLNEQPSLALKLVLRDPVKKHFPRGIPVEALADHGFDVHNSMGDLLLSDLRLDSLPRIRDLLSALCPADSGVQNPLGSTEMWVLSQRRHLIVHKRGRVDAAYLSQTGERLPIGSLLTINASDVDEALLLLISAATSILESIRTLGPPPPMR